MYKCPYCDSFIDIKKGDNNCPRCGAPLGDITKLKQVDEKPAAAPSKPVVRQTGFPIGARIICIIFLVVATLTLFSGIIMFTVGKATKSISSDYAKVEATVVEVNKYNEHSLYREYVYEYSYNEKDYKYSESMSNTTRSVGDTVNLYIETDYPENASVNKPVDYEVSDVAEGIFTGISIALFVVAGVFYIVVIIVFVKYTRRSKRLKREQEALDTASK